MYLWLSICRYMKKNQLIVKANPLVSARYRLNMIENKIFVKLISMIWKNDKELKDYTFVTKDLLEELWLWLKNHNQIKLATSKMVWRVMIIPLENWWELQIAILSRVIYQKWIIKLRFDPDLKPYLLQIQTLYTSYKLENILKLRSYYSQRLYELCRQYLSIGTRKFSIIELRSILWLNNNELSTYANFKQRVLLQANKEINKFTDINISFEEIKTWRKITHVIFTICAKQDEVQSDKGAIKSNIKIWRFIDINSLQEPYKASLWERVNAYKENLNKNPSSKMIQIWYDKLKDWEVL